MPGGEGGRLGGDERRLLAGLGLPSLGLALAVTTVSSLFPVLAQEHAGPALAGALLALEGVLALVLPSLVGAWSDGMSTRFGRRLPFVLVAGPIVALALVLLPAAGGIVPMAVVLVVFFVGYYAYFAPHFALYLDLVPDAMRGRSQGVQHSLRGLGLAAALVGGTAMLAVGRALPFIVAAVVLVACTLVLVLTVHHREEPDRSDSDAGTFLERLRSTRELLRGRPHLVRLLAANALWETALNALRAFVVLFLLVGLGRSPETASLVLASVAGAAIVAAPLGGWLADRVGELPLLRGAIAIYAPGALVPAFVHETWVIAIVPVIACAAVIVMTLPFSMVMAYVPEAAHGGASGLFAMSRGLGLIAGPVAGGAAIALLEGPLAETQGYGAIFIVAAAAVAMSIPLLRRLPPPDDHA